MTSLSTPIRVRITARITGSVLALALAAQGSAGCGGNYSNEDLEFQNAVPARDTLQPQIHAVVHADSSEFYLFTQRAVRDFSAFRDGLLGIIEEVRREPPKKREPDRRLWGPWRDDKNPEQQFRVLIEKSTAPGSPLGFVFRYRIEVARWRAMEWMDFITGTFQPTGGVRRGEGTVTITTAGLRALGLPLDKDPTDDEPELAWLDTLTITYRTVTPVTWTIVADAHPDWLAGKPDSARQARWTYQEFARSGAPGEDPDTARFRFAFRGAINLWLQAAQVTSTWRLRDYAGRADLTVTEGLATGSTATDCWDSSTRATYIRRDWAREENRGDPATCVFVAAE